MLEMLGNGLWWLTSVNFTLTFTGTTLLSLGLCSLGILIYWIRYQILLSRYSHQASDDGLLASGGGKVQDAGPSTAHEKEQLLLPPEPSPSSGLHAAVSGSPYLPETLYAGFLQSIKVFQFLDMAVLKEMGRHAQQRRVRAGEIIWRSDEDQRDLDLMLVMQGAVQVVLAPVQKTHFGPPLSSNFNHDGLHQNPSSRSSTGEMFDAAAELLGANSTDDELIHILNEVGMCGSVSSMFDLLYVLVDQQQQQQQLSEGGRRLSSNNHMTSVPEEHDGKPSPEIKENNAAKEKRSSQSENEHVPLLNVSQISPTPPTTAKRSVAVGQDQPVTDTLKANSTVYPGLFSSNSSTANVSNTTTKPSSARLRPVDPSSPAAAFVRSPLLQTKSARIFSANSSSLVAYAKTETTLLVIPESVLRKICRQFPSAASQLIQIILTRFQRVTFLTLHHYLGLTRELLKIEQSVNEICTPMVGSVLTEDALETMRRLPRSRFEQRFSNGMEDTNPGSVLFENPLEWAKASFTNLNDMDAPFVLNGSRGSGAFKSGSQESWEDGFQRKADAGFTEPEYSRSACMTPDAEGRRGTYSSSATSDQELRDIIFECVCRSLGLFQSATLSSSNTQQALLSISAPGTHSTIHSGSKSAQLPSSPAENPVVAQLKHREFIADILSPSKSTPSSSISSLSTAASEFTNPLKILFYEAGSTVLTSGERNVGLFFVVDGALEVWMRNEDTTRATTLKPASSQYLNSKDGAFLSSEKRVMTIPSGGIAGYLSALTGHASFVTLRAKKDTYVGYISKHDMDRLSERNPSILLTLARRLLDSLSPLVWHIDFALEWVQVNAGQVLFQQDDAKSDCIYIVLNGRLRATQVQDGDPAVQVLNEYGQGESVGELEVLTNTPRTFTVHAIRDTELARMPHTLFNALALRHPEITIQISRIIAIKSKNYQKQSRVNDSLSNTMNLKTVAILPIHHDVPLTDFIERLKESFNHMNVNTATLDSATVLSHLGRHAFSKLGKLKLQSWLAEQEDNNRLVLYVADTSAAAPWTHRCIRQADCILLVGIADRDCKLGEHEKALIKLKTTARKELVLLHSDRAVTHLSTRAWLKDRTWVTTHHHIQVPFVASHTLSKPKNAFEDLKIHFEKIAKLYTMTRFGIKKSFMRKNVGPRNDFARLARRLLGRSIGITFGGGGARGIAHVGVLRAFIEAGIPIDMVGGVSIGSLISGLYAMHEDIWYVYWKAKEFSVRVASIWRQLLDLTYPLTSWFTGREFNRAVWKCFNDNQIEDAWLSYFNITTNITHSRMEIHQSGYFWRFVRASMSLSGYLPPLCDNGNMLLDGGYLNNLPGDVMRSLGADMIIAVDVGSEDDKSPALYGDYLSGWYALIANMIPFTKKHFFPSIADVQSRLAYVSCVKQLEAVKAMDRCIYLRPPVAQFGTLEFSKFDEIFKVGYEYGQEIVKEWERQGVLSQLKTAVNKPRVRGRRNSI